MKKRIEVVAVFEIIKNIAIGYNVEFGPNNA